jgi:peptidyl-tRNA hydrolase
MRKGKVGAQCAHGALLADQIYQRLKKLGEQDIGDLTSRTHANLYGRWFKGDMTKIVLKGNPETIQKAADTYAHMAAIVVDNGFTEIPPNTITVAVLPIMDKADAPEWIKELSLL